jgi:hypothetical protein
MSNSNLQINVRFPFEAPERKHENEMLDIES